MSQLDKLLDIAANENKLIKHELEIGGLILLVEADDDRWRIRLLRKPARILMTCWRQQFVCL